MTVPYEQRTPRTHRWLALSVWSITTLAAWAIACATYALVVDINVCLLGTAHGGRERSVGWAAFVGFLLLLPAAMLAFRLRRRLLLLLAAFLTAYIAGLIILWAVSPAIWGPGSCTGGSLF